MFRYVHNDEVVTRADVENCVPGGVIAEMEKDAIYYPNQVREMHYAGYGFTIEYRLADVSAMEAIGLRFVGEKHGLYRFQYTAYDSLYVIARPWDYSFFRRVEMVEDPESQYEAVGFSIPEAEAIAKFFDKNWPGWRTPRELPDNNPDAYAEAMVDEYGDEAWGWDYNTDANAYIG